MARRGLVAKENGSANSPSPSLSPSQPTAGGVVELSLGEGMCPVLREYSMVWIGLKDCAPHSYAQAQSPRDYSCNMTVAGRGEVLLDGRWRQVRAGNVAIFPPGSLRAFRSQEHPWRFCSTAFRLPPGALIPPGFASPRLFEADAKPISSLIQMICNEWLASTDQEVLRSLLRVLDQYVRRLADPARQSSTLMNLWNQVNSDLARPWDVQSLADIQQTSITTLRRICQRELNCSPMDQVIRLRMGRAYTMLAQGGASVSEVSAAVGYDSPFSFSRAFRRAHGIAPKSFQMQQQGVAAPSLGSKTPKNLHQYRQAARDMTQDVFEILADRGEHRFQCVPMEGLLNRRVNGTAKDVWLGGGTPLEHFRAGRRSYHGIEFDVRNSALVFASSRSEGSGDLPNVVLLPLRAKVRAVYVLHACGWAGAGQSVAGWEFTFGDGAAARQEVRTFDADSARGNIADWWPNDPPGRGAEAMPVIVTSSDPRSTYERRLYVAEWRNPRPEVMLEQLTVRVPRNSASVYAMLAVTLLLG